MTDFEVNFNFENREPIELEATIEPRPEIDAQFVINAHTAVATWGSITGLLSNQTDLQDALDGKVNKTTTVNGYSLNDNISLKTSDLDNDSGYITLEDISSNATGLSYDNTTGIFSLENGYEIPLSSTLDTYITKDVDNLTYYRKSTTQDIIDNELSSRITDEVTARTNADNQLSSRISTEITNRNNADITLQQNIDAETLARSNADTLLSNRITSNEQAIITESQRRANADITLQNNINTEIADREASESNLSDRIDTNEENISAEVIARTNAINALDEAISQEVLDRASGDSALQEEIDDLSSDLTSHTNNTNNPHSVTKAQIGLSNVNNTSDLNKPISTATQNALNQKATVSSVEALDTRLDNIEEVVPEQASSSNQLADKTFVTNSIGTGDLTLKRNNVDIGIFNANAKINKSINIDVPTKTSELTNDANFIDLTDLSSGSETLTYNNTTGVISVTPGYSITTSIQRNQIETNANNISDIQDLIPNQASSSNQLADKDFVNSTIQTGTANFRGNWATWADVPIYPSEYPEDYSGVRTPNTNDYMVVENASDYAPLYSNERPYPVDFCVYYNNILYKSLEEISIPEDFNPSKWEEVTAGSYIGTWRFKYVGTWSSVAREGWKPEYQVNEEPFTIDQWKAINSGITSDDIPLIHNAIQPNDNISELTNDAGYIDKDVNNLTNYTTTTSLNNLLEQKQDNITGGATTILSDNLTVSRALISNENGKVDVSEVTSTELGYLDGVTSNIQTQLNSKVPSNTAITGSTKCKITYDSKGLVTSGADLEASDIPDISDTYYTTDNPSGYIDSSAVHDGTLTIQVNGTDVQTFSANQSNNVTANIEVPDSATWGNITGTLSNQTDLQNALDAKQDDITGGASTITSSDLTASRALISNSSGKVAVSNVTSTELGYLDGVTSSVQTQLNNKQPTLISGTNIKTINNTSLLGSGDITINPSPDLDGVTISKNTNDELQAIGVIDKNTGNAKYDWVGTLSQYTTQAVAITHPDWVCYITDDDASGAYDAYTKAEVNSLVASSISTLVGSMYPVGSIYIGTTQVCPIANLITGSTWQLVATDRVLQGAGTRGSVGSTVNESLPNITGTTGMVVGNQIPSGAFYTANNESNIPLANEANFNIYNTHIDASRSSSAYQNGAPVQQDAYLVNIWERIS